jgi:hypothetical protein
MHRTHAVIAIVVVACAPMLAQSPAPSEYGKLLAQLRAGDTGVDFQKLRFSFRDSPEAKIARDTDSQKKAMIAAINGRRFEDALKNANAVLESEYVDIDAHFAAYIAHRELHHDGPAAFHNAVFTGLLKSITGSGDGRSKETAFVVINTHEEYVLLRFLGLTPVKQSLLEARNPETGEERTLYFNVDISMKHFGI